MRPEASLQKARRHRGRLTEHVDLKELKDIFGFWQLDEPRLCR